MSDNLSEKRFYGKALLVPTLIYALVFTLFRYKNYSSYMVLLQVLATSVYLILCFHRMNRPFAKSGYVYLSLMGLLALSDFLTANSFVITCNNIGILLLTLVLMLSQFLDMSKWSLGKGLASLLAAIWGGIRHMDAPFVDLASLKEEEDPLAEKKKPSALIYCLIGIAITIPILLVLLPLLASADIVFAQALQNFYIDFDFGTIVGIACLFCFVFLASYCILRYLTRGELKEEVADHRKQEPVIAITILSIVSAVYLFFSGIQILYLFLGQMTLPDGYTYAEYAREGFFQLLFVCFLNLVAVLLITDLFRPHKAVKILLTVISACTYIMLSSSALRMCMYIQAYDLTTLRVLTLWALAVLALLLGGIIAYIYGKSFPLWRYALVVVTVCWMLLSFSHMDYWIAKYDLACSNDTQYLTELSLDAAPVIAEHLEKCPEDLEDYSFHGYLGRIYNQTSDGQNDFWHFNLARYQAQRVYARFR